MSSVKVRLPDTNSWDNAEFYVSSVWGNGNDGKDMWGWGSKTPIQVSDPLKEDEGWYIVVTLENPNPNKGEQLAFISRYVLDDSKKTNGALCAMLDLL